MNGYSELFPSANLGNNSDRIGIKINKLNKFNETRQYININNIYFIV